MSITTLSAAASGVQPKSLHFGNFVVGTSSGTGLTASAAATYMLLAKLPPNAKNVQLIVKHTSGAATGVMNYGVVAGDGSWAASVLGSSVASGDMHISAPVDLTWDEAGSEKVKYVTMSNVSGTLTASLTVNYQVCFGY